MSRFNDIAQIYDYKLSQLRDPQVWQNTLRLTSNFWRLNFCAAMLLTEQNPKAVMCGTLTQWNNVGRYVRHGERSTAIFMDRNNTELMYLFDVSQTYGKTYNAKWKLSERMADGIVGKYNTENAENAISFEDFLQKSLDKNIDTVYNYDSKLISAMANDPRITHFIRQSAECICMTRCGLEAEYDFSAAAKLDSDLSIVEIGNAATALAQEVLRDVDRTVRRKEYERYEAGVCGRHLRYPLRGRQERTAEPEIPELWKEGHDAAGAQGGRYDERNGSDSARPGEHERAVSENLEGDWTESRERQEPHNTYSDEEGAAQPDLHGERTAEDGNRYSGSGSSVGFDSDERDLAGGGSQEPWTADEDQGYSSEYDDEELTEDEMVSDESDTISIFSDKPEEIDPNSEYAQKLLDNEISHGSGFSSGKFRIRDFIVENSPTRDELAKFLKNEYGIDGSSRNDDPVSWSSHDSKGLQLVVGDKEQIVRYSWNRVAEAVRKTLDEGRYITDSDIENLSRIAQYDAQRYSIHYEFPNCLENDRLTFIRKEIADCGLDIQIKLNAEMFAVYAAECVRTKERVKECYITDYSPVSFLATCRDSVSELINEISTHTGHNPGLGFPDDEVAAFFASGAALEDSTLDEIAAQAFTYLYNHRERIENEASAEEDSEQLTFDSFDESKSEISIDVSESSTDISSDKVPHDETPVSDSLKAAIEYINDFCETEYGSTADFDNLAHVDLAYTTDEENDAMIGVYADLEQYRILTEFGGNIVREEQYSSLDEMNDVALKNLAFDDLVYLSEEEKAMPHDEAANSENADNSEIPDSFIQDIEEHRTIRITEKEKNTPLYPVEDAADLKLSNFRLSYFADDNSYVLIADSSKAGSDVFVNQFSPNDTADTIYSYLRERAM